jgi:DNA-binding IclR family transcriptional regulator
MRELAVEGVLERSPDGSYVLGTRIFDLVANAVARGDRASAINRVMQDLRDLTGETASLHIRRNDERVCVASASSRHQLRRVIPIGDSVNMVGTVPGDVFLARAEPSEQDAVVSAVLSGQARATQLERIRFAAEHGYSAYSLESAGLTGIAVPVCVGDEVRAALAVSGPSARVSTSTAESWFPDLRLAAKRLEPWMDSA